MPFVDDDDDVDVDVDSSTRVLAIKSKSMIDRRRDVTISSSSMVWVVCSYFSVDLD